MSTQSRVRTPGKVLFETDAGIISNLRVRHVVQNVFWRGGDREKMAATGAVAAALGLSGPAAGMAMMSNEETKEPATRVEFRFGEMLVKGLFWNWPFKEGDSVRVVGRRDKAGNFIALSVLDEQKRLIVSYPYVSSGSWAHWIAVARYSLALSVPLYMIYIGFFLINALTGDGLAPLEMVADAYLICVLVCLYLGFRTGRHFTRFAKMADAIFETLGWPNAKRINLRRITKQKRQPGDHPALGDTYFRY
ncbi:putative type VI secretion system effector [Stenotrophomonas beteli]|uniref:putative type VI secretion system effector n=1 Tax=Stenotrophomonas beteli TaxID=3384461 RepID=UPI000A866DBF|nr:putative type VI secretion system effector [Stenotrophomonas maltophilia]